MVTLILSTHGVNQNPVIHTPRDGVFQRCPVLESVWVSGILLSMSEVEDHVTFEADCTNFHLVSLESGCHDFRKSKQAEAKN